MAQRPGDIRAGGAFVELYADNSAFVRGLRGAAARLQAFGAKVGAIGRSLAMAAMAILAPAAIAVRLFSKMGDEVAKMAKRTGVSVETLSELRFVASQTGTEFATLENGFRKMQRSIYDAGRGLSTAVDALEDLGLTVEDLAGLTPEAQFKVLADGIARVEDPTRKAAIAMSLFGRTGTNLLPMFANGAKGIETLQAKARELGLTMSSEAAKAAEDFTDEMDILWKVLKMTAFEVGAALVPAITKLVKWVQKVAQETTKWVKANGETIVRVVTLAAKVLVVGVALMALAKVLSAVAVVFQVAGAAVKGFGIALAAISAHPVIAACVVAAAAITALFLHAKREHDRTIDEMAEKRTALSRAEAAAEASVHEKMKAHEEAKAKTAAEAEAAAKERLLDIEKRLAEIRKTQGDRLISDSAKRIRAIQAESDEQIKLLLKLQMVELGRRGGPRQAVLADLATQAAAGYAATAEAIRLAANAEAARRAREHGRDVAENIAQLARARALRTGEAPDVATWQVRHQKYLAQEAKKAAEAKKWGYPTPPKALSLREFVLQAEYEGLVGRAKGMMGRMEVRGTFLGQAVGGMQAAGPTDKLVNSNVQIAKHAKSILELLRIGPRFK